MTLFDRSLTVTTVCCTSAAAFKLYSLFSCTFSNFINSLLLRLKRHIMYDLSISVIEMPSKLNNSAHPASV